MKINITQRLMLYFTTLLVIFGLLIGLFFSVVFVNQTQARHENDLEKRAVSISEKLSSVSQSFVLHGAPASNGRIRGTYGAIANMLEGMQTGEVWVVTKDDLDISMGSNRGNLTFDKLPSEAQSAIKDVFDGGTITSGSFGSILGTPSVSVAAPIVNDQNEVIAAVVLHERISDMNLAMVSVVKTLSMSLLAALALGLGTALILSRRFTLPLRKIEKTTVALANGNYSVRTGVELSDEIGSLAKNTDVLAEKLLIASHESEQLEQMRRDYISNISHELRTPVTVIRGSLEALSDGIISEEKIPDYHAEMLKESICLERMVNDLLELSRLQNPNYSMELVTMNLLDALSDAVRSVRHIASEKDVQVWSDLGTKPCMLDGDFGRLRQMFITVLDNAVKFSNSSQRVSVSVSSRENDEFIITIIDHGKGISKEDLPHIFERFYKTSDEKNSAGTGLGLAIANQIADRHSISLTATSGSEGTVFTFRIQANSTQESDN